MILHNAGAARRILAILREEMQLPANPRWVEVRICVDEIVTVTCNYAPQDREAMEHSMEAAKARMASSVGEV